MEVRPGYKQSEVGVIPEDWDARAIGNDIDLLTGFPFLSSGYSESGVRLLRGSNVKRGKTDWADDITQYWPIVTQDVARYELRERDLVIAMDGSLVGRSSAQLAAEDLPALLLQRVARIRSTKKLDVSYLAAFVGGDWFVKHSDSVKTVTAIPHISPADIRSFTIPVPPKIEEQRAIATALSDVDALLAKFDQLIAKKRDLKQAAMQQLLTGQTRMPGFSGEWVVKPLGGVSPLQRGFDLLTTRLRQGCYPVVYSNGVSNYHDNFMVKGPGVVTGRSGTIGNVHFVEEDFWPHNTSLWVTNFMGNSPKFIFYLLGSLSLERFGTGSGVPTLNRNDVHEYKVRIPQTFEEQTAIATVLSDMDAEVSALEARRDKTRDLKQGMMQELLTGRIRLV